MARGLVVAACLMVSIGFFILGIASGQPGWAIAWFCLSPIAWMVLGAMVAPLVTGSRIRVERTAAYPRQQTRAVGR